MNSLKSIEELANELQSNKMLRDLGKYVLSLPIKTRTDYPSNNFAKIQGITEMGNSVLISIEGLFKIAQKTKSFQTLYESLSTLQYMNLIHYHVDRKGRRAYVGLDNMYFQVIEYWGKHGIEKPIIPSFRKLQEQKLSSIKIIQKEMEGDVTNE